MAADTEFNRSPFMEEVQKYPAIYNKFCKDYKNKFYIVIRIWKATEEKFDLDEAEAEKNIRMSEPHWAILQKKSLFHLVLDMMLSHVQPSHRISPPLVTSRMGSLGSR